MTDDQSAMAALLRGLLVGAEQPMESVGDWADHLVGENPTPLVSRFVNQLSDEWLNTLPPNEFCELITERVHRHIGSWHPGWPHLWAHVLRVTGAAVALAGEAGLALELAYLMGICHDVAKLDEYPMGTPHEELGVEFVDKALRGYLPPDQVESIQAAILKEGSDTLANIMHDADKLDKIGAVGLLRRISTDTESEWLSSALWRVRDDWRRFPAMHFDLSRDLAGSKGAFLTWFLPLAEQVVAGNPDS